MSGGRHVDPHSVNPSIFRPKHAIDQSVLEENKALVAEINRRKILTGAVSLGALSMLTGCDVTNRGAVQGALQAVSAMNDRVQALLFRPNHLAPTYPEAQVVKPPRFNAYYEIEDVKPVDGRGWKLELAGLIADKRPWTAEQIYALPEQEIIIRHICVEGWDYIGQWSGVNLRQFLERVGADLTAKYVAFKCADDYTGSIDMASGLASADHPGDQICAGADHRSVRLPVAPAHGGQARLQEPEMDHRHGGHQHLSGRLLGGSRIQLV